MHGDPIIKRPQPEPVVVKPVIKPTREEYVEKWLKVPIATDSTSYVKVKCLKDWQMKFILHNYEIQTAQSMSETLEVDVMSVKLFCQADTIDPMPIKVRKTQKKPA